MLCAVLKILALRGNLKDQYSALPEGVAHVLKHSLSFPQLASHEVPWQLSCVCISEKLNETCIYYLPLLLLQEYHIFVYSL